MSVGTKTPPTYLHLCGREVLAPYYDVVVSGLSRLLKNDVVAFDYLFKRSLGSPPFNIPTKSKCILKRMHFIEPDGRIYQSVQAIVCSLFLKKQNPPAKKAAAPKNLKEFEIHLLDGSKCNISYFLSVRSQLSVLSRDNPAAFQNLTRAIRDQTPTGDPNIVKLNFTDKNGVVFPWVRNIYLAIYGREEKSLKT